MAGRYNPANPSKRPGNYVNFRAKTQQRVNAPLQGVAATIITHDWGPINETVEVNSMGDFKAVFGDSTDTQGYRDVYQLFKGEGGITGRGGAATVLVRRSGTNSAAKAKKNLTNGTDANALVLEAVYAGTKGDDLAVGINPDQRFAECIQGRRIGDGRKRCKHVEAFERQESELQCRCVRIGAH